MKDVKTVGSKSLITVRKPDLPEEPVQISAQDVKLARTSYVYDGTAKKPKVTVTCNDETLVVKTDYAVSYRNNLNVGTATVTITGKGSYEGTVKKTFKITAASIAKATVTCPAAKVWAGWALTPVPTVKIGSKTLTKGTDFTLAFKNNRNVGTATVTITGKGNYTGTINRTFRINPKPTAISKVTPAKGKLTLTWKKQASQTSGYQIQFSSRSDFKTQKTVKVASAAATSRALTGLTRKHKYYVRIRTYKQIGSQYYYSTWSGAKSATTK